MLPFASTVALGLNALSCIGGVAGGELLLGGVLRGAVVPDDFGGDGTVTRAIGLESVGAEITGPEVVAGATVVDSVVAVSAGTAPLSAVLQPVTKKSASPATTRYVLVFIVFPVV